MPQIQPGSDGDLDATSTPAAAACRLAEALAPAAIDALLADAKAAGTPIDGADGLIGADMTISDAAQRMRGRPPTRAPECSWRVLTGMGRRFARVSPGSAMSVPSRSRSKGEPLWLRARVPGRQSAPGC